LNEKNLSHDLFQRIKYLSIAGVLDGIQASLFKDFYELRVIDFSLSNLKEFFHQGNKWMTYLNKKRLIGYRQTQSVCLVFRYLKNATSFDSIYEYPDEDFCFFKDFPHERFVYPAIIPGKQLECTCTLYWLQSQIHKFKILTVSDYAMNYDENDYSEKSSRKLFLFCNQTSFNSTGCNFDNRLKMCQNINSSSSSHGCDHCFKVDKHVRVQ